MNDAIIFFNTGWMTFYQGISDDPISGDGKNVDEMGWGNEIFNFKVFENTLYGFVQPKIDKKYQNPDTVKLERIGGLKTDLKLTNVTVVWTALHPNNGGTRADALKSEKIAGFSQFVLKERKTIGG